jgi:hypothetical protein
MRAFGSGASGASAPARSHSAAARGTRASLKARGSSTRSCRDRKGRRHVTFTPSPQPDLADAQTHRASPFSSIEKVKPRERTVVLRLDPVTLERSPSA